MADEGSRGSPRPLVIFTFGVALVVGAIAALATGTWWLLPLALAIHAGGTFVVLGTVSRRLDERDKSSPTEEARSDADGGGL